MKKLNFKISLLAMFLFASIASIACDINFEVVDGKKATYSKNDELTAKVRIVLTHRNCPEEINKTQLNVKGLEIGQATKWTEKSPGTWERKLKLKITDTKSGKATLNAVRTCKKDGGNATLTLPAK